MTACRTTKGRFTRCRGARAAGSQARGPVGRRAAGSFAIPKAKTIAAGFGISEAQGKVVRRAMEMATLATDAHGTLYTGRGWGVAILEAADKALDPFGSPGNRYGFHGTYGVEYIARNQSKYGAFHYVNTGDSYSPTIAYYPATGRIRVVPGGWAAAAGLD